MLVVVHWCPRQDPHRGQHRLRKGANRSRLIHQPIRGRHRGRSVATLFALAGAVATVAALIRFGEPSVQSTPKISRHPMPVARQTWYAMGAPIGCREKADLQRLTDLSQQKDPAF
jgi:hypothetical protein